MTAVAPVGPTGTVVALAAATDMEGDAVRLSNKIWINNGSLASVTVTLITGGTAEGLAVDDPTVTITAGQAKLIGPFPAVFGQPAGVDGGWVFINYSSITSVTRACLA